MTAQSNQARNARFGVFAIIAAGVLLGIGGVTVASGIDHRQMGHAEGEWTRTSQYVTVRDGTRLAVDVFRPVINGRLVEEPLPVIWTNHRYHRASLRDGSLVTVVDYYSWLKTLLKSGYVIAAADVRGTGASFGTWPGPCSKQEQGDAYDLTEWMAAQPWSNGRIGMYGRSNLGVSQFTSASSAPPHLVAIFPEMVGFDIYGLSYPGGVFRRNTLWSWSELARNLDTVRSPAPVDEDWTGIMALMARSEHQGNVDTFRAISASPFRDSLDDRTGAALNSTWSPSSLVSGVADSSVPIYHLTGWYDVGAKDTLLWFNNLKNPQKVVIGPWSHADSGGMDLAQEHLSWYDYWLKGIENGVMDGPPIRYYTIGAPPGEEWRTATQWPVPGTVWTPYFFAEGPSGSVQSPNDGSMKLQSPANAFGQDSMRVDYTATSGRATRWTSEYGGPFDYPDMRPNDQKGLTYTTSVLSSDVEVTGHPVVNLWVTSTAEDGDFFAYLEDIDQFGASRYVTEGVLRASHRALNTPPYENMGLPYHRSFEEDIAPLPGEPVELAFDLMPVSWIFNAGHRIRVTITGADKDNASTPVLSPPPLVTVHRNASYASHIVLPTIPSSDERP